MVRTLRKQRWCLWFVALLAAGCANDALSGSTSSQNSLTSPEVVMLPNPSSENALRDQFEQIASAVQGRVGIAATKLETGETVALNDEQQFPMQSVYKFPIAMAVLAQVDQGRLALDQRVRVEPDDFVSELQHSPIRDENPQGVELSLADLLRYMVVESDGTACDVLLALIGGPDVATQYLRGLGIDDIAVVNTEKEIGQDNAVQYRNYATPQDAVALLRLLHEGQGLSDASRALLLQLMTETPTGPNRIKGLLPEGTPVAHKTGSSRTVDGVTAATNDVGIVTLPDGEHFAIAVFVADSTADDAARELVIAKAARAAWDTWAQ